MQKNTGFTMMEVVLCLALFSLLAGMLFQIFLFTHNTSKMTEVRSETEQNLRFAAGWITDRIRSLPDPAKSAAVQGSKLFLGAYRYYLSGSTLLEYKDGRANQLAAGITRFEPHIRDGTLRLTMTAAFQSGQERCLVILIYMGTEE